MALFTGISMARREFVSLLLILAIAFAEFKDCAGDWATDGLTVIGPFDYVQHMIIVKGDLQDCVGNWTFNLVFDAFVKVAEGVQLGVYWPKQSDNANQDFEVVQANINGTVLFNIRARSSTLCVGGVFSSDSSAPTLTECTNPDVLQFQLIYNFSPQCNSDYNEKQFYFNVYNTTNCLTVDDNTEASPALTSLKECLYDGNQKWYLAAFS